MRKIFLLVLLFSVAFSVQSASKKKQKISPELQKMIYKIDRTVEDTTVTEFLRKCDVDIQKIIKDKNKKTSLKYSSFASSVNTWIKYRWFIADTGYSKKWLKKVRKLLAYMRKVKHYLETEKSNGRAKSPEYAKAQKYFKVAYDRFAKLIRKPVKVSSKLQRKSQFNKAVWQKNMRKKYKLE
jgi:uncharacterized protein (UPF0147 family)